MSKRKSHRQHSGWRPTFSKDLEVITPQNSPELFVQAHEADIIRGPRAKEAAAALAIDDTGKPGSSLIRLSQEMSLVSSPDSNLRKPDDIWVDRYDARLLLDSIPIASSLVKAGDAWELPMGWSDSESEDEMSEGAESQEMSDEERERKRRHIEETQEKRVQALREQEGDEVDSSESDTWGPDDEVPDEAQKVLMKTTANHILSSPNPTQLEMRILANHGRDPRFAFLRGRWKNFWDATKHGICQDKQAAKSPGTSLGALVGYGGGDDEDSE